MGYLDQLRNYESTFEFLIVKGDISIECSMDVDYFPTEPSSAVYLKNKVEVSSVVRSVSLWCSVCGALCVLGVVRCDVT